MNRSLRRARSTRPLSTWDADVPPVRWVHVDADGKERDFDSEPHDVSSLFVRVTFRRGNVVEEETRTYNGDDGEPKPPPGRSWIQGRRIGKSTCWYRRRWS